MEKKKTAVFDVDKSVADVADYMDFVKDSISRKLEDQLFSILLSAGEKVVRFGEIEMEDIRELHQIQVRQSVFFDDLVRCRDCKWAWTGACSMADPYKYNPDGFCSYGEKGEKVVTLWKS